MFALFNFLTCFFRSAKNEYYTSLVKEFTPWRSNPLWLRFNIYRFLRDGLPVIANTFKPFPEVRSTFTGYQLARWFIFWVAHQQQIPYPLYRNRKNVLTPYRTQKEWAAVCKISWPEVVRNVPTAMWRSFPYNKTGLVTYLATGKNIRRHPEYNFFTRKMATVFHQSMGLFDWEPTIWPLCLVIALGGDQKMAFFLYDFLSGEYQKEELAAFIHRITPLVSWFIAQTDLFERPEVDRLRLADYCFNKVKEGNFNPIKKRTIDQLLRLEAKQHRARIKEARLKAQLNEQGYSETTAWKKAKYQEWRRQEGIYSYAIVELRTALELILEGKQMRHCVAECVSECINQEFSVWSLRRQKIGTKYWESILTIAVDQNGIDEVQGPFNTSPLPAFSAMVNEWADREAIA